MLCCKSPVACKTPTTPIYLFHTNSLLFSPPFVIHKVYIIQPPLKKKWHKNALKNSFHTWGITSVRHVTSILEMEVETFTSTICKVGALTDAKRVSSMGKRVDKSLPVTMKRQYLGRFFGDLINMAGWKN